MDKTNNRSTRGICRVEGCDRPIHIKKRGLCSKHYTMIYRYRGSREFKWSQQGGEVQASENQPECVIHGAPHRPTVSLISVADYNNLLAIHSGPGNTLDLPYYRSHNCRKYLTCLHHILQHHPNAVGWSCWYCKNPPPYVRRKLLKPASKGRFTLTDKDELE